MEILARTSPRILGDARFEVLNVANAPKFGGAESNIDAEAFGRVASQKSFMRIWQLTSRYSV